MNRAQINSLKCEFENLPKVKEVLEGLHHTISTHAQYSKAL